MGPQWAINQWYLLRSLPVSGFAYGELWFHQSHIHIHFHTHCMHSHCIHSNVNIEGKKSFKFEMNFFFFFFHQVKSKKSPWAQHISQYFYKIFVMSGSESMFNFFFLLFCFIWVIVYWQFDIPTYYKIVVRLIVFVKKLFFFFFIEKNSFIINL